MEYVESVLFKQINPGDLLHIDLSLNDKGGGQTYLDLAGIPEEELVSFLEYAEEIPRHSPPAGDARKKYAINAISLGGIISKKIEFDPRNNRPNYKLSDQRKNRHPAWTPENGFPQAHTTAKSAKDINYIPYLTVFIVRTSERKYYASFINTPYIPANWPSKNGLEKLTTGTKRGVLTFSEKIGFRNDRMNPFFEIPREEKKVEESDVTDNGEAASGFAEVTRGFYEEGTPSVPPSSFKEKSGVDEEENDEAAALSSIDFGSLDFDEGDIPVRITANPSSPETKTRTGKKYDYEKSESKKRKIGEVGEEAILVFERDRLKGQHQVTLADAVEWTSKDRGDGLGYDIKSFEFIEGKWQEIFIEVKTTLGPADRPFDVSDNESEFSNEKGELFYLYRVYDLKNDGKLHFYRINGPISKNFYLIPRSYLAKR